MTVKKNYFDKSGMMIHYFKSVSWLNSIEKIKEIHSKN